MDSELIAVCVIQVIVLVVVIAAIIYYLLRNVMLRSLHDDVHDKTIVITGCDSGLGWYLARHCDQLGFRVYAGCCNPAGEGAVQLLSEASARLQTIAIDVTSTDSLNSALSIIRQQLPTSAKGLWALINAASDCVCGELEWQTWQHCQKQFNVNFVGVIQAIRTFMPLLKGARGRVINIGSLAGERNYPEPGLSVYCGTKQAVEGLSEALRFELARHGVNVAVVQPDAALLQKYLLGKQHRHMNEMWDQMSAALRSENQKIFVAYHDRVAREEINVDEIDSARQVVELPPYLRQCFEDALLSRNPSDVYVAVPTCFTRFRIAFLSCLPFGWRQYIILRKYKHHIANILKV